MVCFLTHFLICKLFSIISKIKTIPVRESVNDAVQADDYWWYLFCIQLLHLKLQYLHLILLFWKKIIHCLIKLMSYNNILLIYFQIKSRKFWRYFVPDYKTPFKKRTTLRLKSIEMSWLIWKRPDGDHFNYTLHFEIHFLGFVQPRIWYFTLWLCI